MATDTTGGTRGLVVDDPRTHRVAAKRGLSFAACGAGWIAHPLDGAFDEADPVSCRECVSLQRF